MAHGGKPRPLAGVRLVSGRSIRLAELRRAGIALVLLLASSCTACPSEPDPRVVQTQVGPIGLAGRRCRSLPRSSFVASRPCEWTAALRDLASGRRGRTAADGYDRCTPLQRGTPGQFRIRPYPDAATPCGSRQNGRLIQDRLIARNMAPWWSKGPRWMNQNNPNSHTPFERAFKRTVIRDTLDSWLTRSPARFGISDGATTKHSWPRPTR
jgi:hypothetical protein